MASNVLAFDTALNGCAVGIAGKDGDLHEIYMAMPRGQSERLMPDVERVLAAAALSYQDLDTIVTTVGPGAFAGLRIGLSAAKGLALALDIPVRGVTTLQAMAWRWMEDGAAGGAALVVLETKRDDFYAQAFDAAAKPLSPAQALSAVDIFKLVQELSLRACVGNAVERLCETYPALQESLREKLLYDHIPCGWLAARADLCDAAVAPVYLRGADVTLSTRAARVLEG